MDNAPPENVKTRPTIDQKIARLQASLARAQQQARALEAGQKIVLGGMLINAARRDAAIRKWLLDEAASAITRPADVARLEPLLNQLRGQK